MSKFGCRTPFSLMATSALTREVALRAWKKDVDWVGWHDGMGLVGEKVGRKPKEDLLA